MSTANPFSALERDGSSVGADRAPSSAANDASSSTKRRHRAKKRSSTAGAMTREALMRAREEAHAAMERKLRNGRDECDAWGRVGKGNGLAKSTAKRMAKERAAAAGRRDETKERNEEEEEEEEEEEGTGAMVKESTRVVDGGKSERAFEPKVSEVFHHTFAETGASCWCVDVKDEYGETTTMSITKAVPRVRKIVNGRDERPVLAEEERRAVVEQWNETTRIDRARKAKALRKRAAAEAKERARAEAEASKMVADIGLPDALVSSEATVRTTTPPPGFDRVAASTNKAPPPGFSRAPPGFEAPAYQVVHVPVIDPSIEARQRELEAQVATLQAQLAAQQLRESERRAPTDTFYVHPPRGDSIW